MSRRTPRLDGRASASDRAARGFDRRAFLAALARAGLGAAALASLPPLARRAIAQAAAAGVPPELIVRNDFPEHLETSLQALGRSWITANSRFFVRSHFPAPEIDLAAWRLEVAGLVRQPLSLTLADLRAMISSDAIHVLECAGNGRALLPLASTSGTQWERGAVGNAAWGGVALADVIRRADPAPEAHHVWLEAADQAPLPGVPRFLRSLPLDKAMRDVLLAHTMNDGPLPKLHGAPLRAIVPGWYGMASTKWVTKIRLEAAPSDNHFMTKGYRYVAPGGDPAASPPVEALRVKSVITRPLDGTKLPVGTVRIQGFAWAGPPGVKLVEITNDGGATWRPAGFMGDTAPLAWRAWATEFDVLAPARITVSARATDHDDEMQPPGAPLNTGGYGNNSIHTVSFDVVA